MHLTRKILKNLYYVGVDDRRTTLFENIHPMQNGISYNSYLLIDEKTVLFDTVDWSVCRQFIDNICHVLKENSRSKIDYLVINHMEPDHAGSIGQIIQKFPHVKIISNKKAFGFMQQCGFDIDSKQIIVEDKEEFLVGKHKLVFSMAPMVHWPEAMVTFDQETGVLFSSDAFGVFGALNGRVFADEWNIEKDWLDEARRYYANIVGKFGLPVTNLLKKIEAFDVKMVLPLHGPVFKSDIPFIFDKYKIWASYEPEENGVLIAYGSMYGNTETAANMIAMQLVDNGVKNVSLRDVSTTHVSHLIADSFKYSHIILAGATYNAGIYPPMLDFLHDMKALALQNRTFAIVENGTWATTTGKQMKAIVAEMKNMTILEKELSIKSNLVKSDKNQMNEFVKQIINSLNDK